jgi:UDP-hydrolysing UDP-N-acetyl-D-glucosamine 2-epimerase
MRKVCVVIINRANYGRVKSVLHAISTHSELELCLIVGASSLLDKYGKFLNVLHNDGYKPFAALYSTLDGTSVQAMVNSTGILLIELSTIFSVVKPDIVLAIADRYEAMATAVAGAYMNIPVAHVQGGEVSGSIDESVRHAITKLSHIHFPATEPSQQRLIQLGERPETIHVVGCPSIDIIASIPLEFSPADKASLEQDLPKVNVDEPYILLVQHPVTTECMNSAWQIEQTLDALEQIGISTILLRPNADAGSDAMTGFVETSQKNGKWQFVSLARGFSVEIYAKLMYNCACLVGNSSSGIREGAFLGVPVINVGSRQQRRERGANVKDVPYNIAEIENAVRAQIAHGRYARDTLYGNGSAGKRIAEILAVCELSVDKQLTY